MWPWGHLAVGYLCYTVYRWGRRTPPNGVAVLSLALGTQLPDLIDKPLAYWVGVLPEGRALAHSLFFVIPLSIGVIAVTSDRYDRRVGIAFTIGLVSHLGADAWQALISWQVNAMSYLLWPVFEPPAYGTESFGPHIQRFREAILHVEPAAILHQPMESVTGQFMLAVLVSSLWIYHGMAGIQTLREAVFTRQ